jgi:DNA-binding Lrp family transcriptional regulator
VEVDYEVWKTSQEIAEQYGYADYRTICDLSRRHNIRRFRDPRTTAPRFLYHIEDFKKVLAGRARAAPYVAEPIQDDKDKKDILDWLQKETISIGEMSRRIDRSRETVLRLMQELQNDGYDVRFDDVTHLAHVEKVAFQHKEPLALEPIYRKSLKVGVVSDMHLCNRCQQLTLLHTAYEVFDVEKTAFNLNCGDIVDGNRMHRDQEYELFLHAFDDQKDYVVEHYPESQRKKKTYMIGGSHDMSFKKSSGANIVRAICDKRDDLIYRGEESASFTVEGYRIDMIHPGKAPAYARSYHGQKLTEAVVGSAMKEIRGHLQRREFEDVIYPLVLLCGHYHFGNYMPQYLGVESFLVPCLEAQTPFLKRKGLDPQIGFMIIEFTFDDDGNLTKVIPDFRLMHSYVKDRDY